MKKNIALLLISIVLQNLNASDEFPGSGNLDGYYGKKYEDNKGGNGIDEFPSYGCQNQLEKVNENHRQVNSQNNGCITPEPMETSRDCASPSSRGSKKND